MYEIINEEELDLVSGGIVLTTGALVGTVAACALAGFLSGECLGCGSCCLLGCCFFEKDIRNIAQAEDRTPHQVRHHFFANFRRNREEAPPLEGVEVRQ